MLAVALRTLLLRVSYFTMQSFFSSIPWMFDSSFLLSSFFHCCLPFKICFKWGCKMPYCPHIYILVEPWGITGVWGHWHSIVMLILGMYQLNCSSAHARWKQAPKKIICVPAVAVTCNHFNFNLFHPSLCLQMWTCLLVDDLLCHWRRLMLDVL